MSEDQQNQSQEKTHEPTEKKLRDARQKGQVPHSREVSTFLMYVVVTILFIGMGHQISGDITDLLAGVMANAGSFGKPDAEGFNNALKSFLSELGMILLPGAILFLVAAVFGSVMQNSLVISVERIKPKLNKISLIGGLKKLFSLKSFMEFIKGVVKMCIISIIVAIILGPAFEEAGLLARSHYRIGIGIIFDYLTYMVLVMVFVQAALAALDVAFQKFEHRKELRMTHQEMKDEFKQVEGNPEIKAKLREIRMERARKRMMTAVPDATAVVVNPTHYAVALLYERGEQPAPKCVAKGTDAVALRIREVAEENGVPVVEKPEIARALYAAVDLDEFIPREHYRAVAEILKYVWSLKGNESQRSV